MSTPTSRGRTGPVVERLAVLEVFADAATDGLLGHDLEGRITSCNRSAERLSGFPEAEVIGAPVMTLFPAHLRDGLEAVFESVLAGDRVDRVETELQRKDGMAVPVALSVRPVRSPEGQVVGAVSIAQDLTERRVGQANLAEVEAQLHAAEAHIHVGRWLWDVGTGAVQWSEELHRIHGIDPRDFAGTLEAHLACVHPDDRDRVRNAMTESVQSGRPFELEYRIVRPGGAVPVLYVRAEPSTGSAGTVEGLRGTGRELAPNELTPGELTPDRRGS